MMNLDTDKLNTVVETALVNASDSRAWSNAIRRAAEELEANPYIAYQEGSTLILSPSGEIYTANGSCGCKAYANSRPCWHRAANRLLVRYFQP